jgi:ribose/xylose/arabinose/galactoside ABC-type transport system permease subunit
MSAASKRMTTDQAPTGSNLFKTLRSIIGSQEGGLALSLIVLMIVVGAINPRFVAERNLSTIFLGNAYIAVAAVGMSLVIISGNIDISVGSLIGVLATISGTLAVNGYPIWMAWLVPLLVGGLVGALNGFLVAYLRIPSIVVTLGMLSILKGGLITVTRGEWIQGMSDDYFLAQMRPLGIPMPIYFMIILTILVALWMRYSPQGRAIYAVGGNAEAARLSGISYQRTIMMVFIINGVIVGISSVLFATQLSIIQSTVPPGVELLIITSAVVGGVSILGGIGTVIGSTLAAILLSAIGNALIFIDVSPYWYRAVQGALILFTVLVDIFRRRRQLLRFQR